MGLLSFGLELLDLRLSLRLVPGMEFRCTLHKAVHDVLPGLGLGQGARLKRRLLVLASSADLPDSLLNLDHALA